MVIDPVGYGKGNSVEEHIAREVLVRLARHDHNSVVGGLPVRENYHVPISVVEVDIVIAVTERAVASAHLLDDLLDLGLIAGKDDGVRGVAESLAVFVLHISELYRKLGESLLEHGG